jgi:HEAT repeat protein
MERVVQRAKLDISFADFRTAVGVTYPQALGMLVTWAKSRNRIEDLLNAARLENPGNRELRTLFNEVSSGSTISPDDMAETDAGLSMSRHQTSVTHDPPTDEGLIEELVASDPLLAGHAAGLLRHRPDLIERIVDRDPPSPVSEESVKSVLRCHPERSARVLMNRLAQLGTRKGLEFDLPSIKYFDPAHGPFCEEQLGTNLAKPGVDRQQLSIKALGRCGNSRWGYVLRDGIEGKSEDELVQLGRDTADAMARFFVRSAQEPGMLVSGLASSLRDVLDNLHRKSRKPLDDVTTLRPILGGCDGRHADAIIEEWLTSKNAFVAGLAADVLGDCRIRRAVRPLIGVMESRPESEVIRACSSALGLIGTEESVGRVLAAPEGSDHGAGLVFALEAIEDRSCFRSAVARVLGSKGPLRFLALRAIGRRRDEEFLDALRANAEGPDPIERGVAALALARLGRPGGSEFRRIQREASGGFERILTALAVLTEEPSAYGELEGPLRQNLEKDSYLFLPQLQSDILEVLEQTGNPAAIRLAAAWRPFYKHVEPLSARGDSG